MAITPGEGGSGSKFALKNNGPSHSEEREIDRPIHRTEEFRETVRRIKEKDDGRPITPSIIKRDEPEQPTFKVPPVPGTNPTNMGRGGIPTWVYQQQQKKKREQVRKDVIYDLAARLPKGAKLSDLGGPDFDVNAYIEYQTDIRLEAQANPSNPGDSSRNRHASRLENREKMKQIAQIRQDVLNEYRTPPMGMTPEDRKKFIEKKVQERVERLIEKRPRYVFTSDGTPFALDDLDERAELEKSLIGESPLRRKWTLAKYDLANGIAKTIALVSEPEQRLKEVLTDDNKGNVVGAIAQLGFNSALLGLEYLRAGAYELFVTEERWKRLEQEAEAVKYTDPEAAAGFMASAEHWKKQWEEKQKINARLDIAGKAVDRAWEKLFKANEEMNQAIEDAYDPNARDPITGAALSPLEQAVRAERAKQEEAKVQAESIRSSAYSAFNQGNYEQALELVKQAQAKDREGSDHDAYGAYTWMRQPEREQAFLEDAALIELQKGEKLSDAEIRRLKEYHVNGWTETAGSFIFDPLNLIPAAFMDDALRLVGKPIKAGLKATGKVADKIPVISWLKRETVVSSANKIAARTHDLFDRINRAYLTADETVKAVDEIGKAVQRAKGTPEATARQIFEQVRNKTPGLQNISFSDFKYLMDSADHIGADTWGKMYQDALSKVTTDMENAGIAVDEISKSRRALLEVSTKFHGAFVDAHRIYKGSKFTDDTLAGMVTKYMRELSGEQVNELLKTTKLDDAIMEWSKTFKPDSKSLLKFTSAAIENTLYAGAILRDRWARMVLSTPRWIMSNIIDTSMRSHVYGGGLFDDLAMLFSSTQRTLADELGIIPQALTQSLARTDLDFANQVTTRLLYENWKPKAGLFSYIKNEHKRLIAEGSTQAKREILRKLFDGMPEGKLKDAMGLLSDGFANTGLAVRAWQGGIQDFNTAVEFTFRLRMFHKEYFTLLKKIEPQYLEKGLSGLSPQAREIATQIWKASEGNPRRLQAYAEALAGKQIKGTPVEWAFIVPPEIERITKGMSIEDRQLFVAGVRSSMEDFIAKSAKAGKELRGADFEKFFDDYVNKFRDEMQARMSQSHSWADHDDTIRKDGKMNEPLDQNDLKGSAPIPAEQQALAKKIEKATERLQKGKRAATKDIAADFEVAISEHASVTRVPGEKVTFEIRDGKPVIEIGEGIKSPTELYTQLNEATIQVFKHKDKDYILRSGFKSLDDYDAAFRQFIDDPAAVLNADERQFLTLANQLDQHPQLRTLIERTRDKVEGKINKIKYDEMLDFYRDIGAYSDSYGFTKPPEKMFEDMAQEFRNQPGYHVAAAQESARLTAELARAEANLPPQIADKIADFRMKLQVYREELKQVFVFTYPGPLMKSKGAERHKGWELFYQMSADQFARESQLKQKLIEMIQTNPADAEKLIDEAMGDFGSWFLDQNGIKLEWDADNQIILNMKLTHNGRVRNFTDPHDLAHLQKRLFTSDINKKLAEHPALRLKKSPKVRLRRQLRNALRDTFNLNTRQADAWEKVITTHAEKWSEVTGRPIQEYYERLGFQQIEDGRGLATRENTRMLKRGAVSREDGGFTFYGLAQSNFESMVRETGELFFDDLVSMAEHSDVAADDLKHLKSWIEKQTPGKPIRANRLDKEHSDVLSDLFTSYVTHGDGPDIKIKAGLERFKGWMVGAYESIKDTPIADEISDDLYRVLDRMFIEKQINDVPKTTKRKIKVIAKELGLKFESDDDLLKVINEELAPGSTLPDPVALTPEQITQRAELGQNLLNRTEELTAMRGRIGEADDAFRQAMEAAHGSDIRIMENEILEAQKALDEFDAALPKKPEQPFKSLDEIPMDVVTKTLAKGKESQIAKELNEGWEVWRTQRALVGFPDEALASPDIFKEYLRTRMGQEWSETANWYNRLLWEVEQFEDAMLNYHAGDDFAEMFFPRVPEAQISSGMKTFIRNQEKMGNSYESALNALDAWKKYMVDYADNGHPALVMSKEMQAEILEWSKRASQDKAEMLDTIINGSDEVEGALDLVNKRMIDYQYSNNFDNIMRNFFPFWKFPSRSFPFWAETLATHPQLIANYEKIQRLSRTQRYQAGAVTSKGKPMPSLDGYIKLPGTDMWFNPLAPLSFRYILDIAKSADDVIYAANTAEEEMEPKAFMIKELMQTGQIYGFSLSPWMAWLIKDAAQIPDEVLPRYPLSPLVPLIPRWMAADLVSKANKVTLPFGINLGELSGNALNFAYPEVPWHDYLVERHILEQTLAQIQGDPNLTDAQKNKIITEAQNAIKYKGNDPLWQKAYQDVTTDESVRSTFSFFTGFHPKEFSDVQAALLGLRNDRNQLKSALNNEFQATVFDIPTDADAAWKTYLDALDSPEGWVYRLYTDIGWVRDDKGQLVRDPKDRAKYLAIKIKQDEDMDIYYQEMADLQDWYNDTLKSLPVGSNWEQVQAVYTKYSEKKAALAHLKSFEKYYGTNKPVELIQREIMNDWFRAVKMTQPRWDIEKGETYQEYQIRVKEWETNLPNIAPILMKDFRQREDIQMVIANLHMDQSFNTGQFFSDLAAGATTEGLENWDKENDDVFDALNKAWKAMYWDKYWDSVIGKEGYEVDLAERDFFQVNPDAPDAAALHEWISIYYGPDKFSFKDVQQWVEDVDPLTVEERRLSDQPDPEDYQKRQDIWNMLSWLGPGSRNRDVFYDALSNAGGDPGMLDTWYDEVGNAYMTQPEKLDKLHSDIKEALKTLDLKQPSRAELVRFIQAQEENETFKKLISKELGNRFFDWTDQNGQTQPGVFSFYNGLDSDSKRRFRDENPDEYALIQSYYDMKEVFGEEHKTWNDYYGLETTPTVKLPEGEENLKLSPPSPSGPTFSGGGKPRGSGGGGGSPKPAAAPIGSQNAYQDRFVPSFYIPDRTGNYISPGLFNLVGQKMTWEIQQAMQSGRRISSAGQSFLRSVANRYPEYTDEIARILAN
jgi:hypothetical protein